MTDQKDTHILQNQLEAYCASCLYPFHMPGHKRRLQPAPGIPVSRDVTEVPGTDDLHDAQGILLQAMRRTSDLYGADRSWYLVNGSTCGLLAGIRSLVRRGEEVLCARNCHKAVFHALELAGCRVHWILPQIDEKWGICGGISAGQIASALRRHPSARAVILTSPTYEGILSEVEEISALCHARGIPVLVDEAHGAHLLPASARAGFPAGALSCGADLVVQSPHKTLPSLTQTGLLHLQGALVDPDRVEAELDIFETSSPSYLLLESLDACTGLLRTRGEELFERWAARIGRFAAAVRSLRRFRVLHCEAGTGTASGCLSLYDPGKILIDARDAGLTGRQLAQILREDYRMETEMARGSLVLAMTSPCDSEDALDRLAQALKEIDRNACPAGSASFADAEKAETGKIVISAGSAIRPAAACTLAEAAAQPSEKVPLLLAQGRICAEYLYFYPPGIPILAPGEIVTRTHLELLEEAERSGTSLYRRAADGSLRCLRE